MRTTVKWCKRPLCDMALAAKHHFETGCLQQSANSLRIKASQIGRLMQTAALLAHQTGRLMQTAALLAHQAGRLVQTATNACTQQHRDIQKKPRIDESMRGMQLKLRLSSDT